MPKQYKIRDGFSFVCDSGEVKTGGQIITLDDDVAALHLHKLDEHIGAQAQTEAHAAPPAHVPDAAPALAPAAPDAVPDAAPAQDHAASVPSADA
ncbi:hypothetical protein AAKU55_004918 [Oxalobacteraceae bacterium GrIS 1.11]